MEPNTSIVPSKHLEKLGTRPNPYYLLTNISKNYWASVDMSDMTLPHYNMHLKLCDNMAYMMDHTKTRLIMTCTMDETKIYLNAPTVTRVTVDSVEVDYNTLNNTPLAEYELQRATELSGTGMRIVAGTGILRCNVLEAAAPYGNWEPVAYADNLIKITYTPPLIVDGKYDWVKSVAEVHTDLLDSDGEAGVRYRKLDMKVVRKAREDFNGSMAGFLTMYQMGIFKTGWPTKAEWQTACRLDYDGIVAREPYWWMKLISMDPSITTRTTGDGNNVYLTIYWRGEEYKFDQSPQRYIDRLWRDNKEMVYERVGAERPEVTSIEEYNNRGKKTE